MKPAASLALMGLVGLCVLSVFAARILPRSTDAESTTPASQTLTEPTITFVDPVIGRSDALVTIVEYADFTCSHCRQLSGTLAQLLLAHPQDVRIVWKHMPNDAANPLATAASVAAQCAQDQGKFWEYHDALFQSNTSLSQEAFRPLALQAGLNVEQFSTCYDAGDTLRIIQRDIEEGTALGITATPTLFINGERLEGAASLDTLTSYVTSAQTSRRK